MEIKTSQVSQNYLNNVEVEKSSNVEKAFSDFINENGYLKSSLEETELKKLSYEEAKELRIKLEENGYSKQVSYNTNQISSIGNTLLMVTDFTNDDKFNKALFETMKTKEFPGLYLDEVKHNMEYTQGRRKFPYPTITLEESRGEFSPLNSYEIKNMDIEDFLKDIIKTYENLLSELPYFLDKEETEKTLNDYKELQKEYHNKKDEETVILNNLITNNKINPLLNDENYQYL